MIELINSSKIKALFKLVVIVKRLQIKKVIELSLKFRDWPSTFVEELRVIWASHK